MPHLKFKGVAEQTVSTLSQSLLQDLAQALETTVDNFTFEYQPSTFYKNSIKSPVPPYVEVHLFNRAAQALHKTANLISSSIKSLENHDYVTVVFVEIPKSHYFEDGTHF
jgi:hypothetical protein